MSQETTERPTVEQVRSVISTLYNSPDPHAKEKASEWLGHLQRSVYAWEIADQLLMQNTDVETSYFAAQTMRTKVQYYFHELQPAQHDSLRQSILHHLANRHNASQAIITQLCLALADLAVQMPQWKHVVDELAHRFGSSVESLPLLLELLTVLPEEVDSHHLRVGANRREAVLNELRHSAHTALHLMTTCVEKCSADEKIRIKLFRCAGSWVMLGAFPPQEFVNSKLMAITIETLMNPTQQTSDMLHEAAADFICNALYTAEDLDLHLPLADGLFQKVMALGPAYEAAVNEEDFDRALNLCRVFTEMGESFLHQIVDMPGRDLGDLRTLSILLSCVQHNQYEIAEITFNFWYRLSEAIFKTEDDSKSNVFKPYIEKLIESLSSHCRMEADHEGIPDEESEFSEFRERVSELIKDCVFIVSSTKCFQQMYQSLVSHGSNMSWEFTESILFVMATVARAVALESDVVAQFLPIVLNLPEAVHIAVKYTSIRLIGELADWIEKHPDFLDPIMQFLLSTVQVQSLSSVSAVAVEQICVACHKQMGRHFDVLAQVVIATDSLHMSSEATVGLIKGVCKILEGVESPDKITEGMRRLCSAQVSALNQISHAPANSFPDPTLWLDRLAAVFRSIEYRPSSGKTHPCQVVVEEVWPTLANLCEKYQHDVKIIERCCRCMRFAVRCIGKSAGNLLSPMVDQMVRIYANHKHSCFLYLGSILVDEYGDEEGCVPGLVQMTKALALPTFEILSGEKGLVEHPDTVDDLYRLISRCIQKFPLQFLQCDMANHALQCAIAAATLQHREANSSVMKFLKELILSGAIKVQGLHKDKNDQIHERSSLVRQILSGQGQNIVNGLIHACAGSLPTYMIPEVADVIYELLAFCRQETLQWISHSLSSLPTQSVPGHVIATPEQLREFHNSLSSASNQQGVWKAAKVFSRLFR
ncbi:predicted protein [Nematostella vectensis]|uniref:Transportin-3 n=1 Tax=Nematostella vectensis TaxID=45351 RepID=A7SW84_NEMVE|nr:predicted protein [Nematostella vectensis]|eukprot:XP_001624137.1 predicted protein [Nematostella vectensis]